MLKAIIFDFDGVICESVDVKTEAFRKLFSEYPRKVDKIIEYHMANGGISRYKKFEVIYRDILKKPLLETASRKLGERFTSYVYQGVVDAPYVQGAYEFLTKFKNQCRLFVASGTPQEEMDAVIRERELEPFFTGVYGSPMTKHEIIEAIVSKYGFKKSEMIFVGDSINDYAGAKEAGINFIGRLQDNHVNPFEGIPFIKLINNMGDLELAINA